MVFLPECARSIRGLVREVEQMGAAVGESAFMTPPISEDDGPTHG